MSRSPDIAPGLESWIGLPLCLVLEQERQNLGSIRCMSLSLIPVLTQVGPFPDLSQPESAGQNGGNQASLAVCGEIEENHL